MHAEHTSGSMHTARIMQAFKCEYSLQARAVHIHKGALCLDDVHRKKSVDLLELGCCHSKLRVALLVLLLLGLSNAIHFLLLLQLLTGVCIVCSPLSRCC